MADKVETEVVSGVADAEAPTLTNNVIRVTSTLLSNGGVNTEIANHLEKVNQADLEGLYCGMVGSILGTAYKLMVGKERDTPELRVLWFNTMVRNSIPFFNNGISQNNFSSTETTGQITENDVNNQ